MSDRRSSSSGGASIGTVVQVVFIIAKFAGWKPIAAWPWLWVLAPTWIGLTIAAVILLGFAFWTMMK